MTITSKQFYRRVNVFVRVRLKLNKCQYSLSTAVYLTHNSSSLLSPITLLVAVSQVETTVSSISFWMTANLLTLNSSETDFMLISLPQQHSKLSNPSLSLPSSPHILSCTPARSFRFVSLFPLTCKRNMPAVQHLSLPHPWLPPY